MKKISDLLLLFPISFGLIGCKSFDYYNDFIDKAVEIKCSNGVFESFATGTLISKDGLILTNKHVVNGCDKDCFSICFENDNREYKPSKIIVSNDYDLAVMQIDKTTKYFSLISEHFKVGETIYTIGNSNGFGLSLLTGIISSDYKNIIYEGINTLAIQTNIEIYNGSSGGPLYNKKGELLGITTFRIKDSGVNVPGMSFVVPSICINDFLTNLDFSI